MLKQKYDVKIATGTILASGTLGQIIPPSIILILLGDVISSSYQEAQNMLGMFSQESISVGDLFAGAIFPGLILVAFYILYILYISNFRLDLIPRYRIQKKFSLKEVVISLFSPIFLILIVLGSIISGITTATEASSFGAIGSIILAIINKKFSFSIMKDVLIQASKITSMIFILLIGATIFSLVFRGLEGDIFINNTLSSLPGDVYTKLAIVMFAIFLLGFILDFIEITYVVIPVVAPILLSMGIDPIWLGILIAINLQTSFLTPPFGFAIFYLKSVIPRNIDTLDIYKGVIPFIVIQIITIILIVIFPEITTWLPNKIFG
jgi:tripartite ATP-independent transporter DctM subunit